VYVLAIARAKELGAIGARYILCEGVGSDEITSWIVQEDDSPLNDGMCLKHELVQLTKSVGNLVLALGTWEMVDESSQGIIDCLNEVPMNAMCSSNCQNSSEETGCFDAIAKRREDLFFFCKDIVVELG
jgi:hypothetical protein